MVVVLPAPQAWGSSLYRATLRARTDDYFRGATFYVAMELVVIPV
jgi:hypothetical protein